MAPNVPAAALAFASEEFPAVVTVAKVNPYTEAVKPHIESRKGFALTMPGAPDSAEVKAVVNLIRKAVTAQGAYSVKVKIAAVDGKTPTVKINLVVVDKITRTRKDK